MAEERVQRRLAAILAADVVGYSRMMSSDESATLSRLKSLRSEVFDPKIEQYGGRIFKTTGDGALAEFGSAVGAVQCSVEIQRELAQRNSDALEDQRMALRIGISLGDVVVDGDDLYGNGVNVATRMEGLAEPGSICVSGNVQEHVGNTLDVALEDLGEQIVKNIDRPVRCYRVQLEPDGTTRSRSLQLPDKPSIAVLPFTNMSGDPDQEYFSDGISEDIITALSRIRQFFVIARNTTFTYKGKSVDVQTVTRDLGVRYVLEGGVRKAGNRVRITAQLIDGDTGNHIWAERYDRELEDIFAVQDEITTTVVGAIGPELERAEQERARVKPPEDLHAWDLFQRGMWHLYRRSEKDLDTSLELFQQAIDQAPDLAVAQAGAEEACFLKISSGYSDVNDGLRARMLAFGRRAVELDDLDAFTHLALGRALNLQGENEEAIATLEMAVRLNPSFASAHYALGWAMIWGGHTSQAVSHIETAMRLSPHDPAFGQFLIRLSEVNLFERRPEDAIEWARKSLRQPNTQNSRWVLFASSLAQAGQTEEAHQAVESLLRLTPGYTIATARDIWRLADAATKEYVLDGLRKAGLPEN